jgi:hypothetical protein
MGNRGRISTNDILTLTIALGFGFPPGHGTAPAHRAARRTLSRHRPGNERKAIFRDDHDRGHLLELLSEATERFGIRVQNKCQSPRAAAPL